MSIDSRPRLRVGFLSVIQTELGRSQLCPDESHDGLSSILARGVKMFRDNLSFFFDGEPGQYAQKEFIGKLL